VRVTAEHLPDARHLLRSHGRRQKALLRTPKPHERIFETLVGNLLLLRSVDERFKRRGLYVNVSAAHQEGVASGRNRFDRSLRNAIGLRDRLHLQVIAHDDTLITELVAEERDFETLSLDEWRAASDLCEADVIARITPAVSVQAKRTPQSTAPDAVRARLADVRRWLDGLGNLC